MPSDAKLPGLDRLIESCQRHSFHLKLPPPLESAPQPGEAVLGEPVDPQLATVYHRLGAAEFGDFALYAPSSAEEGLIPRNEWLRKYEDVQFSSSLVFGWEPGFSFYYGTIPKLADAQGLQPVVYIQAMEGVFAVPVASSVDRFFNLYSRYLELLAVDPDYLAGSMTHVNFPWGVRHLVVQDEPLISQVRQGRFDFLTDNYRDALQWLQELRTSVPQAPDSGAL